MATSDFKLSEPPIDPRKRELWLQHAVGFILFEDVRDYALQRIEPTLTEEAKTAAKKGIDDAVYGLMMVLDGVTGGLANDSRRVSLRVVAELTDIDTESTIETLDLIEGDGMCMGYHGWINKDFGERLPFISESDSKKERQ